MRRYLSFEEKQLLEADDESQTEAKVHTMRGRMVIANEESLFSYDY